MVKKISGLWKTFNTAAGIRWKILGLLVSLALERADWLSRMLAEAGYTQSGGKGVIFGFPSWILGIVAALSFATIWFFSYAHKLRTGIQVSRVRLSELRRNGVELRNKGAGQLTNNAEWEAWRGETIEWQRRVYDAIKEISVADAEWFDTMDVVPDQARIRMSATVNQDTHPQRFREHDFQVERLGEMIRDLWGK